MSSQHRKGQIVSFDFMVSVGAFLIAVILLISLWTFVANRINAQEDELAIADAAQHASNQLLLTGGDPASWQLLALGDVNALGISDGRDDINSEKLERLVELNATNYSDVKEMLGVGKYDVHLEISYLNGTKVCEFGKEWSESETEKENYVTERMALLNGSIVNVKLEVWK